MSTQTQTCRVCGVAKPLSAFASSHSYTLRVVKICKPCSNAEQRERRSKAVKKTDKGYIVLTALKGGPLTVEQLEERVGVYGGLLTQLRSRGLIRPAGHEAGLLELTDKGRALAPCRNPVLERHRLAAQEARP